MRLARFGLAGLANTLLDAVLFNLLSADWLGLPVIASAVVAGSVAMLNGFVLHQRFTFRVAGTPWPRKLLFVLLTAASVYGLRPWLMAWVLGAGEAWVSWLPVAPAGQTLLLRNLAWFCAVALVMLFNYVGYRRWVFISSPRTPEGLP